MTPPTRQQLGDALARLRIRHGHEWYSRYKGSIGVIEGITHELAHAVSLGLHPQYAGTPSAAYDVISSTISRLSPRAGDTDEARTLRIEHAALAELGCPLSLRSLVADAQWNNGPPPGTLTRPLSRREARLTGQLVQIIVDEIEAAQGLRLKGAIRDA